MTTASPHAKSPCNTCGRSTDHGLIHTEILPDHEHEAEKVELTHYVLRCLGCRSVTIKGEIKRDGADPEIFYKPARVWTQRPRWLKNIKEQDDYLYGILTEVYSAANDEQSCLLAMGVRTTLDYLMTRMIGDVGTFKVKLAKMVEKGHLAQNQKEMLETVIDAGSAAAHRGFKPSRPLLEQMLLVMEALVGTYYISSPMLLILKEKIPPPPPRDTT